MTDLKDLEAVAHWDGDPAICEWCGDDLASVCIKGEGVCCTCHTIAYERALIRDRDRYKAIALAAEELAEAAAPYVSPVQNADFARQQSEFDALLSALRAYRKAVEGKE